MVAPKNISKNLKEKPDNTKSKSPSPEPFQEPDGMTTIDLNKSDDYSKESELEKAEIRKKAQIKYVAQLLFALGSIFVIVLLIIMMTYLNTEYHIFTVIPFKPTTHDSAPSPEEEFVNITRIINQEKFKEKLDSGKYLKRFPVEMDLCKIFKSVEFCCNVFKYSDLQELTEFCTVNDMLNYLIEYEMSSKENQRNYEHYPKHDLVLNKNNNLDEAINKRNSRQISHDSPYDPQYPYYQLGPIENSLHEQQFIDHYNDFNQYQKQMYEDQYLEAPHVPNKKDMKPTISTENIQEAISPLIINKKYKFPENLISEIERSHHGSESIDQLVNFDIGQWAPEVNTNFGKFSNQNGNGNTHLADRNQNNFQNRKSGLNEDTQIKIHDVDKVPPKLQSVLIPLPEDVREKIMHHVTVAPKLEHVYKSGDFQQGNYFNENHHANNDYEGLEIYDPGRLSNDDRRPEIDYTLKVDANGKFHVDSNKNSFKDKKIDQNRDVQNYVFGRNAGETGKYVYTTEPLKVSWDLGESKIPLRASSELLRSSLLLDGREASVQSKIAPNFMLSNSEPERFLEPVVLPDLTHHVLNSNVENSKEKDQNFKDIGITKNTLETSTDDIRGSLNNFANYSPQNKVYTPSDSNKFLPNKQENIEEQVNNLEMFSENKYLNTPENFTETPTFHTTINNSNDGKQIAKNKAQKQLQSGNVTVSAESDQNTILALNEEETTTLQTYATSDRIMIDRGRYSNNPIDPIYGNNIKIPDATFYKSENIADTVTLKNIIGTNTDKEEKTSSIDTVKNGSKTKGVFTKGFSRSSAAQDFRGKQKPDSFTASEDMQSNQQTYINPCFNPYMSPYVPFMPPAMPPTKLGNAQEPGYLKVVSVSPPHVQNQPMYVLNPSMLYGIPPAMQSTYPSLTHNQFLPQGYFPQVAQPPYGGSYSSPVQVTSPGGQYYMCNPIPTPSNNIAGIAGVEVRRDASNLQSLMEGIEDFNRNNNSREATLICPLGEQACLDNVKCIKNHHICDSEVHCEDSSDEIGCTCKERVGKLRLCDGYCDCPTCEDEQGCFGCEEDEYSCDDWSRFRRSTCVPISQRCDGIKQCEITGKDEMDCSILVDHIGNFPLNKISNAVGFLHRNYKGKWYPTCFGTELWAAQVCQVEAGPSAIIPKAHMTLTTDPYNGLFINILPNNKISLVNTCVQDRAAFVECPPIYCGLRFLVNNPYRTHEVDTSIEDMLNDLERAYKLRDGEMMRSNIESDMDLSRTRKESSVTPEPKSSSLFGGHFSEPYQKPRDARFTDLRSQDQLKLKVIEKLENTFRKREISNDGELSEILQQSRVVGGKPSQPAAWPWLVSIYKNGIFHCGGVLINELWIVTASHCVDRYWQYYYEIQAGALRRFSYSPMDQRRWAKVVVPHELYSKSNLRNDIALMKLSAPLRYNKYVRPICLPSEATSGQDFLKGPSPGTICTTVGWGATVEHGTDPDHMREVEVPILQHCKHKEDSEIEEICAGLTDGGKDACQGDSGGPLMCRNPNNPNQWYLAGIVSHGEGCARPNEPGVYTKVSRYMGWIAENTREGKFTATIPLQKCPGYVCKGTKRCVPKKRRCDRIIDCLLGDDEINCEDNFRQIFKHSRKSTTFANSNNPAGSFSTEFLPCVETIGEFGIVGSKSNETIIDVLTKNETRQESNVSDKDLDNKMVDRKVQEKAKFEEVYFKCQMMLQVISINKRCNKIIDCEDGTDEFNCTCVDYIKNDDPSAICDGVSDCPDLSDEKDCVTCSKTQYTCRLSKKCIHTSKRCDGNADCPQNEDELNCASLTNGHTLSIDRDNRPMFKSRGIVTINHLGQWKPLCLNSSSPFINDEPSLATVVCNLLGFNDYFSYHKYLVENVTINETYSFKGGSLSELEKKKCKNCCEGLYISCSNTSTSTTLHYKSLEEVKELYVSPWTAAIYSNGHYKCVGTLLDHFWIVTSVNCFRGITILQGKYLVAVFGRGKINLSVKGPHEQIIRIVESVTVNETDILLLRLEQDVKYNRYVQAANLNVRKDGHQIEKCFAVGQDNDRKVKFVSLSPLKNCLVGFRCFEKKIEEPCNDIHSWSGTIICDSRNGWYPAAVFKEETGHCGFHHEKKYTSVKFYRNEITRIMAQTANPIPPPPCDGLQCNLGNCLPKEKTCDGVVDCHSGEDERTSLCYEKEKECYTADNCVCPQTHLICPNTHKCFPKSSFCDRVNNCGEFEDEPEICSCRNYLKLTNPGRICDGVLNCMDRTDEDPNICTCTLDDFECGKTNKCIPYDMVCDGVKDCPNGEDEATCLSLNTDNHDRTNAGEVMTRTAGIWHTGCFDLNYSTLQLEELCYNLGFSGGSANQLIPPHNITTLTTLRPVLDTFDVVWLRRQPGNKLKLRIRTGHDPYVKFVPDKKCHRLFIACI